MAENLKGVVLKVASLCNLNCYYCYMYNLGDNTFKLQPKVMALATVNSIANEIKSHISKLDVSEFDIVFHGGEPLLATKKTIKTIVEIIKKTIGSSVILNFSIQTNGTLINRDWCDLFKELEIQVSISIDGPEIIHNSSRRYHDNKGSYNDVMTGISVMNDQKLHYGTLFVMNLKFDAIEAYQFLKDNHFLCADFLFPDANYDNLPPDLNSLYEQIPTNTPYGEWWIEIFKVWYFDKQAKKPVIRFLEQIILLIIGCNSGLETVGKKKNEYLIIDTDGSIEPSDFLKLCGNGFTKRGYNINKDSFEEAQSDLLIKLNIESHSNLSVKCKKCAINEVCGGGHLAHRFSKSNNFNNPSIYCYDLLKLITYVQNTVLDDIDQEVREEENLRKITYDEALTHFN